MAVSSKGLLLNVYCACIMISTVSDVTKCHSESTKQDKSGAQSDRQETKTPINTTLGEQHEHQERDWNLLQEEGRGFESLSAHY